MYTEHVCVCVYTHIHTPGFIFLWREGPSSDQVLMIRIRLETRLVCRGLGCAHSEARVLASTMPDIQ